MIKSSVLEGILTQTWSAVVLNRGLAYSCGWMVLEIEKYYTLSNPSFFGETTAFYPVTGARKRPDCVYLRKSKRN
jgi:hypothetical protein